MPNLQWNEVQDRAIAFSRKWSDAASEAADKQTFWNEFFEVFGRERRNVASFEVAVRNIRGQFSKIDLLWRGVLLVEHKTRGHNLAAAESQAFEYIADLLRTGRGDEVPRFVILSDFERIALYDLQPEAQLDLPLFAGIRFTQTDFPLSELNRYKRHFAFIKGERTVRLDPEDPANARAYLLMCKLHDELEAGGFTGGDLERLLVRLLFCLFAEDTEVFEPNTFTMFLREHTREDGSDLGGQLNELFDRLNTPKERWPATGAEKYAGFKYVNGRLFADRLGYPGFNREMRKALLDAAEYAWQKVSPAVFGSLFQGIKKKKDRRQQGAHYTSERDILKVIRSLFLDDLRAEFARIVADKSTRYANRLLDFHAKLRTLRFLDPACGCGNFLVLSYRELRLLDLEVLQELHAAGQQLMNFRDLIQVDVDQFHGIELDDWAARIAEVAMWLMDHQMNQKVSDAFGTTFERLPLRSTPHIVQGNALRIDWLEVLPPAEGVFVLGNPPFVGKHLMTPEQEADMFAVWGELNGAGFLDYVTGWYGKAAMYIQRTRISVAFVSTNSIMQGEQAGILWGELFQRWQIKIHFAHRTFSWESEAKGAAHVHVVIIGFGAFNVPVKRLFDYESRAEKIEISEVNNISPYLLEGPDIALPIRRQPVCDVPAIVNGNKPADGGFLILEDGDRAEFLRENPTAAPFVRPFLSADEYLNGRLRWVLWLVDAPPQIISANQGVRVRVQGVRDFRSASKKESTRRGADFPALFQQLRQPVSRYILIPRHSSEKRKYVPFGYFDPEVRVRVNFCGFSLTRGTLQVVVA